ncbi:MAG: TonB-dependent receptor [Candidatus Omnitrophica bacterium]|nr:TonB-dependent receptor [Candidatus Omnitrophota bacterium]
MKYLKLVLCLYAGIVFLPSAQAAQEDSVTLGRIVVTASRMAQHDYKVASDVTIIGKEDIEASTANTVSDILEEQLGINLFNNGSIKSTTIDIRGFGDTASRNVLVLVDDKKINSIDISGPDLFKVPLESIERIEVLRGAGSVLYGDNAVGGVINIITKEGEGDFSGSVGACYGSYDARAGDVEASGEYRNISYYFYSQYYDNDGYRENSEILAKDFNSRLGYELTDKLKVGLITSWHEDDYGLPGGLNDAELEELGRRGSADYNDFASTKDRHVQLFLDVTPWPEDIDWGHFVFDFSYRNRDTYAEFTAFDFNTKRSIDTVGLTGKYVYNHEIFNQDLNFVSGIDFYNTNNDIIGSGSNSDDLTIAKDEFGAYTFAEYEFIDSFFVNAGTRYQKAYYIFDQRSGVPSYQKQNPDESVNMVGGKWEYAQKSNFFFNVQQTFRFLATDEWYDTWNGLNTDLKQQTGVQYEAGVKHTFNDYYNISVTPYWIKLENEIFYDPQGGAFGFGSNSNYDKTRRTGVEVGQKVDLLKIFNVANCDQLEFFANYSYQDPRFIGGDNDDKKIPMAPQHLITTGLTAKIFEKFRISFTGNYVGSRFAINDTANETSLIKPHFILDSKLTVDWDPWEVFVSVNNINDKKYHSYVSKSTSSTAKDYFPAPERNFLVGAKLKF